MNRKTLWKLEKAIRRKVDPFPHMAYVKKYNYLFIHIPKNAGTSILDALSIPFRSHSDYKIFKSANTKVFNRAYKFCFVRNPYDRMVSVYNYLYQGGAGDADKEISNYLKQEAKSFDIFVDKILDAHLLHTHPLFRPQFSFICDFKYQIKVDYVAKFENISQEIAKISMAIDKPINLKKLNAQKRKNYHSYYNSSSANKIYELYLKDFELFDYDKDSFLYNNEKDTNSFNS